MEFTCSASNIPLDPKVFKEELENNIERIRQIKMTANSIPFPLPPRPTNTSTTGRGKLIGKVLSLIF